MGPNNNHNKKSFNRLSPWFVQQQIMLESNLNGPKAGFFFSPFSLSLTLSLSLVPFSIRLFIVLSNSLLSDFIVKNRDKSGDCGS